MLMSCSCQTPLKSTEIQEVVKSTIQSLDHERSIFSGLPFDILSSVILQDASIVPTVADFVQRKAAYWCQQTDMSASVLKSIQHLVKALSAQQQTFGLSLLSGLKSVIESESSNAKVIKQVAGVIVATLNTSEDIVKYRQNLNVSLW